MIQRHVIEEGNLKVVKCTDDFGGPNMWNLYIKDVNGWWEDVQWGDGRRFQRFFKTQLPVYKEVEKKINYELA